MRTHARTLAHARAHTRQGSGALLLGAAEAAVSRPRGPLVDLPVCRNATARVAIVIIVKHCEQHWCTAQQRATPAQRGPAGGSHPSIHADVAAVQHAGHIGARHATYNVPRATCNMQHGRCDVQHATCNMRHGLSFATCQVQRLRGWFWPPRQRLVHHAARVAGTGVPRVSTRSTPGAS